MDITTQLWRQNIWLSGTTYLEEPYLPHKLVGVMAGGIPAIEKK